MAFNIKAIYNRAFVNRITIKLLLLPTLIVFHIGVSVVRGDTIIDTAVVEFINSLILLILVSIFGLIHTKNDFQLYTKEILNPLVGLLFFIGVLGLIKLSMQLLGVNYPMLFIEGYKLSFGTSLMPDYNFYALYFILAVVLIFLGIRKNLLKLHPAYIQIVLVVYSLNIVFSFSRRGILVFGIILLVGFAHFLAVQKKQLKDNYKLHLKRYYIVLGIFIISLSGLLFFRYSIFPQQKVQKKITSSLYKYWAVANEADSFEDFETYLWRLRPRKSKTDHNLLYNGSFEFGNRYWKNNADSVRHSVISTPYGNGIRVERFGGSGGWPLLYKGRPIYFYKNTTYRFSFYYRVVEGMGIPFQIGFWVIDDSVRRSSLPLEIEKLDSGWTYAECSYTFKEDHDDIRFLFMNNQKRNTIVEFADICLEKQNGTKLDYIDQLNLDYAKEEANLEESFFKPRIIRWKYFYTLWTTKYRTVDKIFGKGFEYMEWYGNKFYGNLNKMDWPHNPFLSVLLYSGILGFLLYILLIINVLKYYISIIEENFYLFLMFLSAFIFSFFSANTPLSPPILGFLTLLPYLINMINRRKVN